MFRVMSSQLGSAFVVYAQSLPVRKCLMYRGRMKKLIARIWNAEPVALIGSIAALVPIITNGLVVFDVWGPTADQLSWVNSAMLLAGAAVGIPVARSRVSPIEPD